MYTVSKMDYNSSVLFGFESTASPTYEPSMEPTVEPTTAEPTLRALNSGGGHDGPLDRIQAELVGAGASEFQVYAILLFTIALIVLLVYCMYRRCCSNAVKTAGGYATT